MTISLHTDQLRTRSARGGAFGLLRSAGAIYVLAWIVGLFVAPSGPANDATASDIQAYFAAHAGAFMVQSLLVHGVAGAGLVVLALVFSRTVASRLFRRLARGAGLAAAAVSFVQVACAIGAVHGSRSAGATTTAEWFHAINTADVVKLMLLASFAGVVSVCGRRPAARWLRPLGMVLVPLLVLGGLAFVVSSSVLSALLDLSLLALLVWAGAAAWTVGRPVTS